MADYAQLKCDSTHPSLDMRVMQSQPRWLVPPDGRRRLAARHYARAVARGDFRSLGRAAVAWAPPVRTHRMFELLGRDDAWVAEAERWLQRFAASVNSERRFQ